MHFIRRHDTLQTGFDVSPDAMARVDLDPEDITVVASESSVTTSPHELRDHLRYRFTEACDPLTFPAYLFATIERDSHYTVVSAFDHTLVDGYSLVIALGELRQIYQRLIGLGGSAVLTEADLTKELGDPGSFLRYCELEAETPVTEIGDPRVREWARFYERCGGTAPSFPLDLGVEAGRPAPQGADVRPSSTPPTPSGSRKSAWTRGEACSPGRSPRWAWQCTRSTASPGCRCSFRCTFARTRSGPMRSGGSRRARR